MNCAHERIVVAWKYFPLRFSFFSFRPACKRESLTVKFVINSQFVPITLEISNFQQPDSRTKSPQHFSIRVNFPFVHKNFSRAASFEKKIFLDKIQLTRRTRRNRNATFCFHDFLLQSVMIAFIKMKKCKIKFHWVVERAREDFFVSLIRRRIKKNKETFATWILCNYILHVSRPEKLKPVTKWIKNSVRQHFSCDKVINYKKNKVFLELRRPVCVETAKVKS